MPAVCHACGRTVFSVLRAGTAQLQGELSATAARTVVEVTKETSLDKLDLSCAYVGTEALLYRVSSADVVVFLDIDAELMAPRLSALADTLALLVRAARVVGIHGRIIVQTRAIDHPLIQAIQKQMLPMSKKPSCCCYVPKQCDDGQWRCLLLHIAPLSKDS